MAWKSPTFNLRPKSQRISDVFTGFCRVYASLCAVAAPAFWCLQCSKLQESRHTVIEDGSEWELSGPMPYTQVLTQEQVAKIEGVPVETVEAWAIEGRVTPTPQRYRRERTVWLYPINYKIRRD